VVHVLPQQERRLAITGYLPSVGLSGDLSPSVAAGGQGFGLRGASGASGASGLARQKVRDVHLKQLRTCTVIRKVRVQRPVRVDTIARARRSTLRTFYFEKKWNNRVFMKKKKTKRKKEKRKKEKKKKEKRKKEKRKKEKRKKGKRKKEKEKKEKEKRTVTVT
jgi:cell division ATPase FtsA